MMLRRPKAPSEHDQMLVLRAQIEQDLPLWRQVPWCELMGGVLGKRVSFSNPSWCSGPQMAHLGLDRHLDIVDILASYSHLWLLDPTAYIDASNTLPAVDCRTGELMGVPFQAPARPLSDGEVQRYVLPQAAFCDPRPLVSCRAEWEDTVLVSDMLRYARKEWFMPELPMPGAPPSSLNQAVAQLAGSWQGSAATLLDTARLLDVGSPS